MAKAAEARLTDGTATRVRRPAVSSAEPMQREADEREHDDRDISDEREMSEDDRLEIFRDSLVQSVLPDLPKIEGYHVCWLTTTNPRDTIAGRLRLGYELIRAEEVRGYEAVSLKTGDYAGCVGVNEMLAAKIPLHLYNGFIREVHERMPLAEEEKLRANTDRLRAEAESAGARLDVGDGTAELGKRVRPMEALTE